MPIGEHPMIVGCVIALGVLLVLAAGIAIPIIYVPCPCEVCS